METESDWGFLDGEPVRLNDVAPADRARVVVRLPSGALVRPFRFSLGAREGLAEVSETVEADE